ncbi:tetratricopeptide repeat protein [Saccharothrix obliqua]|uniref:tetratricopeptide repeat protein n=1 Tax=Saccharothrix obliqua TaxID=2861747 RepID=UPI001C603635|nr:tetratricopeptide repeat protein [Saccharothrix obliqua]MBW4721929.1 tetratricopeptide repeat protein [Saccharothrix obliqua]
MTAGLLVALTAVGVALVVVLVVLARRATANRVTGGAAGPVLQAASIGSVVIAGGAPAGPRPQVVVGEIPREPPDYQTRHGVRHELGRLAGGAGVVVVCAMTGQRGVGKSQLAAAHARDRIRSGWPVVAWIGAETPDLVLAGLAELSVRLGVRAPQDDVRSAAMRVRSWLENRPEPALLVFDNATDPDAIGPYIPASGSTEVVITSTWQAMGNLGELLVLDVFDRQEALDFLAAAARHDDPAGADDVATELGRLPLALAQAAAVIRAERLDYRTYLARLRATPVEELLVRRPGESYPRGTAEAILLSLDEVGFTRDGLAARLLRLFAVLSADGVPRRMLHVGVPAATVDAELARLSAASIVTFSVDDENVIMHRLVQRVIRDRCARDGTLAAIVETAVERLSFLLLSESEAQSRRRESDALIRQVAALWEHCPPDRVDSAELFGALVELRTWSVRQLIQTADLHRAALAAHEVAADAERVLPAPDPRRLGAWNDLASIHIYAGRTGLGVSLYEDTLRQARELLGGRAPEVLRFERDLAWAYVHAGMPARAVSLYERVVAEPDRLPPATHAGYLNELATACDYAQRPEEARHWHDLALRVAEENLEPSHPVAILVRHARGYRPPEPAEPAGPARLPATRPPRLLGASLRLANEGWVSAQTRALIGALEREPALWTHTGGEDVVRMRADLVRAYLRVGRATEAVGLARHNLACREADPGPPPAVDELRDDLALAHETAGDLAEAARLYEVTLEARRHRFGPTALPTLTSEDDVARVVLASGDVPRAVERFERTLNLARVAHGGSAVLVPFHNNLGRAYEEAGYTAAALQHYRAAADLPRDRRLDTGLVEVNLRRLTQHPFGARKAAPARAESDGEIFGVAGRAAKPVIGE